MEPCRDQSSGRRWITSPTETSTGDPSTESTNPPLAVRSIATPTRSPPERSTRTFRPRVAERRRNSSRTRSMSPNNSGNRSSSVDNTSSRSAVLPLAASDVAPGTGADVTLRPRPITTHGGDEATYSLSSPASLPGASPCSTTRSLGHLIPASMPAAVTASWAATAIAPGAPWRSSSTGVRKLNIS